VFSRRCRLRVESSLGWPKRFKPRPGIGEVGNTPARCLRKGRAAAWCSVGLTARFPLTPLQMRSQEGLRGRKGCRHRADGGRRSKINSGTTKQDPVRHRCSNAPYRAPFGDLPHCPSGCESGNRQAFDSTGRSSWKHAEAASSELGQWKKRCLNRVGGHRSKQGGRGVSNHRLLHRCRRMPRRRSSSTVKVTICSLNGTHKVRG